MTEDVSKIPTIDEVIKKLENNPVFVAPRLSVYMRSWFEANGTPDAREITPTKKRQEIISNFWAAVQGVGIRVTSNIKFDTYDAYLGSLDNQNGHR